MAIFLKKSKKPTIKTAQILKIQNQQKKRKKKDRR